MAVRNARPEDVSSWLGLNTTEDSSNLSPTYWSDSMNAVVGASGATIALNPPQDWNNHTPAGSTRLSIASWNTSTGSLITLDEDNGSNRSFYAINSTTGGLAGIVSSSSSQKVVYANANNNMYFVGISQSSQIVAQGAGVYSIYKIGIDAPSGTAAVSIAAGGTLTLNVGATVSYAYYNATTGHCGRCSTGSATSGPTSAGNNTLRIAVSATAESGVSGIILFISTDGGATRYLLINATTGAPVIYSNASGNINISAAYSLDTNTTEPSYNLRPLDTARFIFSHQSRVFLCNYTSPDYRWQLTYSGLEAIGIGQPTESFPALNIIALPSRAEVAVGGVSTPVGALILSDKDGYILQGQVSDNVVSTQNVIQASASLQHLKWGVGTRSPSTIQGTPLGIVWMDQSKRIQFWSYSGMPVEIGLPIRNELKSIQDGAYARLTAESAWFQYGDEQYYYILSASTSGSTNNKLFIVGIYRDPSTSNLLYTTAVSNFPVQSLTTHVDQNGVARCLASVVGGLYISELFNFTNTGGTWPGGSTQTQYFSVNAGNFKDSGNYTHLHSIRFDCTTPNITVQVMDYDGTNIEVLQLESQDGSYFGMCDRYGVRKTLKFIFPTDQAAKYSVKNLRITYSAKGRTI